MTVFEKNLETLAKISPALEQIIRRSEECRELTFFHASSGSLTLSVGGKLAHSRRDPEREAARIVASSGDTGPGFFILLGFGLGYTAEACRRIYPESRVIVILPDTSLFAGVCRKRDLTHLIADPAVRFAVEPDPGEISSLLSDIHGLDYSVLRNRGITGAYEEYFVKIEETITSFRSKQEINRNTLIRFGKRWVNNLLQNIRVLLEAGNVGDLAGLFADMPCLLLAAGPTLEDIAEDLPAWRERSLIVAVDTAAEFCMRAGIEPDFLVVVDPQFWNSCYLERVRVEKTILVSESSTHPRVFRLLPLQTFFCGSLFPLGKYLEEYIGQRKTLGAGGSVATTAWDFARTLGCSPVFCAGLDLGFPRMQTHYRGSFFEERIHSAERRLAPGEGQIFSYTYGAEPFYAENYDGGKTLTDKRLVLYKWWFEGQARSVRNAAAGKLNTQPQPNAAAGPANAQPQHDAPFGTAGAAGADKDKSTMQAATPGIRDLTSVLSGESVKIEGFQAARPGIVKNLSPLRCDIEKTLAQIRKPDKRPSGRQGAADSDSKRERLTEGCRRLITELAALRTCALRGVAEVEKLISGAASDFPAGSTTAAGDADSADTAVSSGAPISEEALRRLDEIDAEILSSGSREIAGFLLQQVAKEISENTGEHVNRGTAGQESAAEPRPNAGPISVAGGVAGKSTAGLENSLKLYQALRESVEYHISLLRRALDRL